jgi:predicted methyltransferase
LSITRSTRGHGPPQTVPQEGAEILARLAEQSHLQEGAEGVRTVLRAIQAITPATTQSIARACRLPVPVVAALRREMEHAGLLRRGHGMELTEAGRALAEALGLGAPWEATCATCEGRRVVLSRERRALAVQLQREQRRMPPANLALDQAHSLPESSLRRALYMAETGALDGRAILCLGDDDCVSLALALLLRSHKSARDIHRRGAESAECQSTEGPAARLVVVDCDTRLLEWLAETAAQHGLPLECVAHDLREPLPERLRGAFDVFETDPPYTMAGLRLFLSRAVEALRPSPGTVGFLSFAHRPPEEQREIARTLLAMGFAIDEIIPNFNQYVGAGILGNRGQIVRVTGAGDLTPPIRGRYDGPLYTAQSRPATEPERRSPRRRGSRALAAERTASGAGDDRRPGPRGGHGDTETRRRVGVGAPLVGALRQGPPGSGHPHGVPLQGRSPCLRGEKTVRQKHNQGTDGGAA